MARIRTIKPEFPQSESMGRVSRDARLCFVEMWTIADDAGRLRGASRMLASLLFPYDDDAPALIDGWLAELEQEGCIIRYQVGGSHFIQISKWLEHQKIDKPSPSKLPEFVASSREFAKPRECSSEDLDLGPGPRKGEDIPPSPPVVASEASAPSPAEPTAPGGGQMTDWDDETVAYLRRNSRETAESVRAVLADLRKSHSAEEISSAIDQARCSTAAKPLAFVGAHLSRQRASAPLSANSSGMPPPRRGRLQHLDPKFLE